MRLATSFTVGNRFAEQHLTEVLNAIGNPLRTAKDKICDVLEFVKNFENFLAK